MRSVTCPLCGAKMKKNGKTKAGKTRWRCTSCNSSSTVKYRDTNARFKEFLEWLFSKDTQLAMPGQGRTFRRKTSEFWQLWPQPPRDGEWHSVVFVDGIHLGRDWVVLIASTFEYVLGWYFAKAETTRAWEELLKQVPAPAVVITDGGSGFASAVSNIWPNTRIQRCLFHVHCQVRRYTTSRPNLQAGRELYRLSIELMHIDTLIQAEIWFEHYMQWCEAWNEFLDEKTWIEGRYVFTHIRLRKARSSISRLISNNTLFTYLDSKLVWAGTIPRTNNHIEGGVNARLRDMIRNHRGMSSLRRAKAIFWWCYMHTEEPLSPQEILRRMPKNKDFDYLYKTYSPYGQREDGGPVWGDKAVWEELHHRDPYPYWLE